MIDMCVIRYPGKDRVLRTIAKFYEPLLCSDYKPLAKPKELGRKRPNCVRCGYKSCNCIVRRE